MAEPELPGGPSPRWVSGEKYDRAYAHANHLSRRVAALTEETKRLKECGTVTDPMGKTWHRHGDRIAEPDFGGQCFFCAFSDADLGAPSYKGEQ